MYLKVYLSLLRNKWSFISLLLYYLKECFLSQWVKHELSYASCFRISEGQTCFYWGNLSFSISIFAIIEENIGKHQSYLVSF